jgi:hypothetical protein
VLHVETCSKSTSRAIVITPAQTFAILERRGTGIAPFGEDEMTLHPDFSDPFAIAEQQAHWALTQCAARLQTLIPQVGRY